MVENNEAGNPQEMTESGFNAEFGSWGYIFKRLNDIQEHATNLFLTLNENPKNALPLLTALNEIWRILRPISAPGKRVEIDGKFKDLKRRIRAELESIEILRGHGQRAGLSEQTTDSIDSLFNDLGDQQQNCGLGVPGSKPSDKRKRVSNAIEGHA